MCKIVDLIVKHSFIFKLQSFSFTSMSVCKKQKDFFEVERKFFSPYMEVFKTFDLTALLVGLAEMMAVRIIKTL